MAGKPTLTTELSMNARLEASTQVTNVNMPLRFMGYKSQRSETLCLTKIHCGSEFIRECARSGADDGGCADAFANEFAPTV